MTDNHLSNSNHQCQLKPTKPTPLNLSPNKPQHPNPEPTATASQADSAHKASSRLRVCTRHSRMAAPKPHIRHNCSKRLRSLQRLRQVFRSVDNLLRLRTRRISRIPLHRSNRRRISSRRECLRVEMAIRGISIDECKLQELGLLFSRERGVVWI